MCWQTSPTYSWHGISCYAGHDKGISVSVGERLAIKERERSSKSGANQAAHPSTSSCRFKPNNSPPEALFVALLPRVSLALSNVELARSTRMKDQSLVTMNHELRTPLNTILGMAESIQEKTYGVISPIQSKALAHIESSGMHLLDLINDTLYLAKIEAGKLEVQLEPFAICALCQSCITSIQLMVQVKGITHSATIETVMPVCLLDQRLIRQVLTNLLSNAVKFTPEAGTVRLRAKTDPCKAGRPSVWHASHLRPGFRSRYRSKGP